MKKITLFVAFMFSIPIVFAQLNPCPTINNMGYNQVSGTTGICTYNAYVNATGTSSRKNIRVQAYVGSFAGTPVIDECIEITRRTTATYQTSNFTAPCGSTILLIITRYTASNGTCQGGICGTDTLDVTGGPLPIGMKAFYAKRKNASVTLSWQTESEINAKEFIVQRKTGNDFTDVGTVAAKNIAEGSTYSFGDVNNAKAVSQYRLKLVDLDGSFKYSEIRAVKGNGMANDFVIFPNPSRGNARVTITDISEPTDVQLVDNSGRVIKVVSMNNSNTADFIGLQKGLYLVRIINKTSGESLTKKLSVIE